MTQLPRTWRRAALATTSVFALSVAACGDNAHHHDHDEPTPDAPPAGPQAVSLRFAATVGDEPAACDQVFTGFGPNADISLQFQDLRFYVHDIEFIDAQGGSEPLAMDTVSPWQNQGVALLDFEDQSGLCANGTTDLRSIVTGTRAAGTYTGLRFTLGVPFAQNHQDASLAAAPLNLTSLFWNWQGGYKFARIDTSVEPADPQDPRPVFNFHLGSTGCDGSPAGGVTACTEDNLAVIELTNFDVEADQVAIDYRELVGAIDLAVNGGGPPGCMSGTTDPECPAPFANLGLAMGDNSPAMTAFAAAPVSP